MVDTKKRNKIRECIVNNQVPCLHEEARERVRMERIYILTQAAIEVNVPGTNNMAHGGQREITLRIVQDQRGKGNRREDK
jgi:hypothetical protein